MTGTQLTNKSKYAYIESGPEDQNSSTSANLDNDIPQSSSLGGAIMNKNMTLAQYIPIWLELFKKPKVKPSTYSRLVNTGFVLGKYDISQITLSEIDPLDVQAYINAVTEDGYSFSTIKKQLELVKASLRKAVSLKLIPENPADEIEMPGKQQIKKKTKEIQAYDQKQQARIQQSVDAHADNPAFLCVEFMIETGLRSGESLALSWSDVNVDTHRCSVHATVVNQHQPNIAYVQDSPKTDASIRTVPLTPKATAILKKLKQTATSPYIFGKDDRRLEYPTLIRAIKKICAEANIPYRGAHVFRHTFATNCYYKGIDIKILSKLLGHSDVKVTYNTYINLYGDGFDDMYTALCL